MSSAAADGAGNRFEIGEKRVVMPPEIQCLQSAEAAVSRFASRYLAYRHPLRFFSDDPTNRCDVYYLSPWMVMAVVDVAADERFESPLKGQGIVEFHYRISGSIEIGGSWGECRITEPSCLLWFQPDGCDDASERLGIAPLGRETWISLYCDRSWLDQVNEGATAALEPALAPDGDGAPMPSFRIGPHIGATIPLLRELVRANREDPLHWLYASAKANELLYVTLSNPGVLAPQDDCRLKLTQRDRKELHSIRDTLAAGFVAPPRLPVLARHAGMNYSKLCAGFRQLFGESIAAFVRRRRLEFAHELLQKSDLQVRQIARQAGYAHHGSFTTAFSRQFGVAPKQLRRATAADGADGADEAR
ncbi:MAG TPA: helix-turn-helix transcriptional regulator [Steroidobacteraceae bacterium]|nr:helix-turn-helix transcriptional regulator [Steroidobacteraceae bacterium]